MSLRCIYLLGIVFLLLKQQDSHAQAICDTLFLSELEIFGEQQQTAQTAKTHYIDSLEMRDYSQQDLGELLSALTTVYVKSYGRGTLSTVSFRGTGSSHTQVLWEGFQINSPMLGQVDFSQVPNAFFTGVELFYGGASLIETSGAIGGSVSLSAEQELPGQRPTLNFEQTIGSFNTYLTSLGVNMRIGKLQSFTKVVRQSSTNDFKYYNNGLLPFQEMKQQLAAFSMIGFMQQLGIQFENNGQLYFITWNQWSDRDLPPVMPNVFKLQEENQHNFTSRNVLGYKKSNQNLTYEFKGALFLEDYHYSLESHTYDSSHNTVVLTNAKNLVTSVFGKGKLVAQLNNGIILLSTLDLNHQEVNSSNYEGIKSRNTFAAMVSVEKTWLDRLTMKVLLRESYSDELFLPLLPYFGLNYQPFKLVKWRLRFNVSKNYKLPSLNDLYFYPVGNEDLLPEEAVAWEGGINFVQGIGIHHALDIDFSVFYSNIKNWIQWMPSDFVYWVPTNVPRVVSKGMEASVDLNGELASITWGTSVHYAYTITEDENVAATQVQLPYIPIHQVSGVLSATYKPYFFRWNISCTGERYTTLDAEKDYSNVLPAYWLQHLTVGRSFSAKSINFELRAKVYNIFDVDYQAVLWRAMPGRYAEVSINLKW